ncbi:NUDIX hydrolase [Streptomyces olivaceus]|uniref:NUDIX hydrolase n=1 Tax=Streptomyces TaxID=1883 RepID=UPI001413CD3D|nr:MULTISPECIES: CoA pyrophosphatase [Streptomyces]MBZ6283010.1 CoA pyrophosphatase [Streptomyces olivaceus]QIP75137.1 CoA pyrophosphatase [Streptomyces sp. VN1]
MTRVSGTRGAELSKEGLPGWLDPVARAAETVRPTQLSRFLPPADGAGRQSAVLILFGDGTRADAGEPTGEPMREGAADPTRSGAAADPARAAAAGDGPREVRERKTGRGPELLLMERAGSLRSHPGQPAFPGGALDPEDGDPRGDGPLRAALREAEEETGLDPAGVQLFGVLPKLYIPVSGFVVTPVLAWWREPSPVGVVDPGETARVFTVPVADLTDPANRVTTLHPSGHRGPAFLVESALVWGFTAGVIDRLLHFAGWERPWDREKQVPLDWRA